MVTRYGLEGGAVYALSAGLRDAIGRDGTAALTIDLRPDLTVEALAGRLAKPRGKDSATNWLRKVAGLSPVAVGLLREIPGELPAGADKLAKRIKAVRLTLTGVQGLARAISSAVVRTCTAMLASFSNCCGIQAPGVAATSSCASR